MRITPVRQGQPLLADDKKLVSKTWFRWFHDLIAALGFDNKTTMFHELGLSKIYHSCDVGAVVGGLQAYLLDAASTEEIFWSCELPNNYREGTNLVPYYVWAPTNTNTGSVMWELGYSIKADAGTMAETTVESLQAGGGTADVLARVVMSALTGTSFRKGDIAQFCMRRKGGDGDDDYNADAALIHFGVKYQIDGVGWEKAHP